MSSTDEDIAKLVSRADFFEAAVDQLKKDLPKYLMKNADVDKFHRSIAKTLRAVASSEPNKSLQDLLFQFAEKHEVLEKECSLFNTSDQAILAVLDDSKKRLISPMRDIISEHSKLQKKNAAKSKQADKANENVNAANTNVAVGETPTSLANVPVTEHSYVKETLPVHVRMFERHRVANLRSVIRTIVEAELKFHCKAVQELSTVLKTLATTSEDDMK